MVKLLDWLIRKYRKGMVEDLEFYKISNQKKIQTIIELKKQIPEPNLVALQWDNKWPKNEVTYKAQGYKRDVRSLVVTKSYIIEQLIKHHKLDSFTGFDDAAKQVLQWCIDNITYVSDIQSKKMTEFWQHPEETIQTLLGDCEDGSLLIISILRILGLPAYRIKMCCGWVRKTINDKEHRIGHAYPIYLADDNEWYILDWCYYPERSLDNFNRNPHQRVAYYEDVWWTFNDEHTWSQHCYDADQDLPIKEEVIHVKEE